MKFPSDYHPLAQQEDFQWTSKSSSEWKVAPPCQWWAVCRPATRHQKTTALHGSLSYPEADLYWGQFLYCLRRVHRRKEQSRKNGGTACHRILQTQTSFGGKGSSGAAGIGADPHPRGFLRQDSPPRGTLRAAGRAERLVAAVRKRFA